MKQQHKISQIFPKSQWDLQTYRGTFYKMKMLFKLCKLKRLSSSQILNCKKRIVLQNGVHLLKTRLEPDEQAASPDRRTRTSFKSSNSLKTTWRSSDELYVGDEEDNKYPSLSCSSVSTGSKTELSEQLLLSPRAEPSALWRDAATCSSLKHPLLPQRERVSSPDLVFLIFVVSLDQFVGGQDAEPDGPGAICNVSFLWCAINTRDQSLI